MYFFISGRVNGIGRGAELSSARVQPPTAARRINAIEYLIVALFQISDFGFWILD
jgi:hypothetical protein